MMKKGKGGFVYSTNSDFNFDQEEEFETLDPSEQTLSLHFESKGRGGKVVCIVRGFIGRNDDLNDLGKALKSHCGVGGSTKNGEILLQGNVRPKAQSYLESKGYQTKLVGG